MPLTSQILAFGDFRFDTASHSLSLMRADGVPTPVPLGSRAADLLHLFLHRPGDLIAKNEIMDAVWPNMAVEDSNVTVQISALRRALEAGTSGQNPIQTVPGRGYRFTLPVAAAGDAPFSKPEGPESEPQPRWQPSRRALLIGGGAVGAGAIGAVAIIAGRGTVPEPTPAPAIANGPAAMNPPAAPAVVKQLADGLVKIGLGNPLSGAFAALGANELRGCQVALEHLNARNGILGRKIELISYDSTSTNPGTATATVSRLIEIDKVEVLIGNLQSAPALALIQLSSQRGILQIVTTARADEITGAQCKWNVFRLASTTLMQANAICPVLFNAYGKTWQFITSDYAFAREAYQHYDATLRKLGGRNLGNALAPLNAVDFSSYLIEAQAAKPDVLVLMMSGADLVTCLRQASQLGIDRTLHISGGQLDLETIEALPPEARIGTWPLDWHWKQGVVAPGLDAFVAAVRARTAKVPTAHTWFGYVAIQAYALACEAAKTMETKAVARALANMALPPEIRLQPNSVHMRGGDHQLVSSTFIGELLPKGDGDPENLVKVAGIVAGDSIAPPVADTGCTMQIPA